MTTVSSLCTDQELIAAAVRGNTRAYGELVARYRVAVVNVVYRMCGDAQLSEEAAQDAFLRAWQHLSGYQPERSFRSWVFRIAINAALDTLRRDKRLTGLDELAEENLIEEGLDPERMLVERERAERVRRAVLALPPASRSVLILREYASMSYAEIASSLGIPLGTVMSRLNSARGQLRLALVGMMEVI